jgi:hypothetical protein
MMVQLIRAKFAGAQPERVLMDGRTTIEVARVRITEAGRQALTAPSGIMGGGRIG